MKAIELFAGAGGLAIGTSRAGFEHSLVLEWDQDACDTIRDNQKKNVQPVAHWPTITQTDVRSFDFKKFEGKLDLVAGGPPCQPFSLGGKHGGFTDNRDMFPQAVRAIREARPKAFIFENVKGLTRPIFSNYFQYISLQLTYPELVAKNNEAWTDHFSRLERFHTRGKQKELSYKVVSQILNAADYGVPQKRQRVFIVGFRSDMRIEWSFPAATHSAEALAYEQSSSRYWDRHRIAKKDRPSLSLQNELFRIKHSDKKPWLTVRDAICDLPEPTQQEHKKIRNHRLILGARTYPGHTGSLLDQPAKTLKAGAHGVPGGENMLLYPNGKVRYFTVRESARLQTFPDSYVFNGSWTECMRQLGNAVPVKLAEVVANSVMKSLTDHQRPHLVERNPSIQSS